MPTSEIKKTMMKQQKQKAFSFEELKIGLEEPVEEGASADLPEGVQNPGNVKQQTSQQKPHGKALKSKRARKYAL